jgi:hypothetical protein
MASKENNGRPPEAAERLNRVVENFHNLTHGTDQVKNVPEIELTEEQVRYLEQHGTLPESSLSEPLRKAS